MGSALAQLRSASDDFMRELTRAPRELEADEKPPVRKGGKEQSTSKREPGEGPEPPTNKQIRDAALKLGIKVQGKTSEELRSEMLERVYSSQTDSYGLEEEGQTGGR